MISSTSSGSKASLSAVYPVRSENITVAPFAFLVGHRLTAHGWHWRRGRGRRHGRHRHHRRCGLAQALAVAQRRYAEFAQVVIGQVGEQVDRDILGDELGCVLG